MAIQIINDQSSIPDNAQGTAATIGVYDGVHLGHRQLLSQLREKSKEQGLATAVITFDQHPTRVTSPENAPKLLTSFSQKMELFESQGIDYAYIIKFDKRRSMTPAAEFFQSVFVEGVKAKAIIVGEDFQFGHNREGDVTFLKREGAKESIEVQGLPLFRHSSSPGDVVSSTTIRMKLTDGDMKMATEMLGRRFELEGTVMEGDQRGRQIGFPTANLSIPKEMLLPRDGVYACWYKRPDGSRHMAAVNIGLRPTFQTNDSKSVIEAHLIDFDADLYGESGHIEFVEYLREEQQFDGVDALAAQLKSDVEVSQSILGAV
ncbi:MAG: bifunctional riboflavin kinase/FMN adenylyltransferase [Acidimicrobiaceae bacterium]|nr:bifunctional riboflavin kinase/FMN adenylyltransferase [Acidimicrobiaceae bacterium]